MITKKGKKKKGNKTELEKYEENIQSMRSWVRKIEQSTNSLGGRLKAVEERVSKSSNSNLLVGSDLTRNNSLPLSKGLDSLDSEEIVDFSNDVIGELDFIKEELSDQSSQISSFESKIDDLNKSLEDSKKEIIGRVNADRKILSDVEGRIEKVEDRSPFFMKLGRIELPLEVAGIVSGFIAFVAAVLMAFDMKDFLISPPFLAFVGLFFIGAALFKSFKASGLFRKKGNRVVYKASINDKSEGFEEKYVA